MYRAVCVQKICDPYYAQVQRLDDDSTRRKTAKLNYVATMHVALTDWAGTDIQLYRTRTSFMLPPSRLALDLVKPGFLAVGD